MVERPAETRQEENRALLGPHRRVGQRQTASLTRRMPEVRLLPRRLWPRLKWTTRRDVAPEEAGSSPAGHPIHRCGGSGIGGGPYPPLGGFDSRSRDHGPVAQPGSAAPLQGEGCGFDSRTVHHADVAQTGEARRSDRRQCRFESDRQYHLDVAQRERTGFGSRGLEVRALPSRPMRGGGTGTTPGPEPGSPGSKPGLAALRCLCGCRGLLPNLAGYCPSALPAGERGRYRLGRFTDATFTAMKVLEDGRNAAWPF